jgi:hypothetical protein
MVRNHEIVLSEHPEATNIFWVSLDEGQVALDIANPDVKLLLSGLANLLVADVVRDLASPRVTKSGDQREND